MSDILVYIELLENEITDVGLQCLTKGRELADKSGSKLCCVVIGSNIASVPEKLACYGPDTIFVADDARLKNYLATPYKKVLADLINKLSPKFIFFPASTLGNDFAATVSSEIKAACILDCKKADYRANALTLKRLEFDGKVLTNFTPQNESRVVATLKDGIADVKEDKRSAEVVNLDVVLNENDLVSKVINREIAKKTVNLKAAKIIVTAGAGVGSRNNFKLIEDLATAIGGEIGATRPVVDAGWASHDRQIGQTGTTVKPDLYIACGVSGAVQHRVGMMDARTVIAINTDPSAPIFRIANYNIVGDLNVVVPKLTKLITR